MSLSFVLSATALIAFFALTVGTAVRMRVMGVPWPFLVVSPLLCVGIMVFLPMVIMGVLLFRPAMLKVPPGGKRHGETFADFSFPRRLLMAIEMWMWVIQHYPVLLDLFIVVVRKLARISHATAVFPAVATVILKEAFA